MSDNVDAQRWWVVTVTWNGVLIHGLSFGDNEVDAIAEFEDCLISTRYPDGLPKDRTAYALSPTLTAWREAYHQTRAWFAQELAESTDA
jgi:hypothetical protein